MAKPIEVWGIPTCGTTRKALKLLEALGQSVAFKNYREVEPDKALLNQAMKAVDAPKKMFNTSGGSYREGGYKDKADSMSKDEMISALLADPMLIKRPILRSDKGIVVGYDEKKIKGIP